MRNNKKILYLDSKIVAKMGIFQKLMISGDDHITINELVNFNVKWSNAIVKELNYDDYYKSPKSNLEDSLLRFAFYDEEISAYRLDTNQLKNILSSIDKYKNELSANKMYMSVFELLLEKYVSSIKQRNIQEIYNKIKFYSENSFKDDSQDIYSTRFSNKEISGKMLLMYFEIIFEKRLGLNFVQSIPNQQELDEQTKRLDIKEKSFLRIFNENNLSTKELEVMAKSIREKRFNLASNQYILSRFVSKASEEKIKTEKNTKDDLIKPIEKIEEKASDQVDEVMKNYSSSIDDITNNINDSMVDMKIAMDSIK